MIGDSVEVAGSRDMKPATGNHRNIIMFTEAWDHDVCRKEGGVVVWKQ
jgi:hypothetical protein